MAPRQPRSAPSRRRARAAVPSVASMTQGSNPSSGLTFESSVIGQRASRQDENRAGAGTYKARARRKGGIELAERLAAARGGDESALLDYVPTDSSNPPRPRTLAAGYDKNTQTLFVRFRDGTPWEYYDVPPNLWRNFQRVQSPGRFINRVLNNYPYGRGDW